HINIIQKQFRGGVNIPKVEIVKNLSFSRNPKYEVLIFDCGSDNRVKSEILYNIENLRKNGYEMIVGLRDLYPMPIDDLEKLEKGLRFLPNKLKDEAQYFDIVIAIHEIEAWFLAETNHLKKIDKRLTGKFIKDKLGFDPYTIDAQSRVHPAKDLDDIYRLVGRSYTKRYNTTTRIVNKLDFNSIRFNLRYEIRPLDRLLKIIEKFKGNNR
ncbi:DUF4276 family protein, partial [Dysgonomonas sp. Marseille-P4677]|uniref:DUF4276 family protein n=1 Tax=Dysgonomonas sp. Marseille-P4677 TaxID=2364790 RepID=UPI001912712A